MKAVVYRRYGDPEVLEYTDVPDPKLSQNSVLVPLLFQLGNDHSNKERVDESGRYEWYRGP